MILVDASGVSMSRPERSLFDNVSLTISSGDRLAIVGLNGSGKSTLARVLVGAVLPESGVVRRGRDVRVTMLDQASPLPPGTVRSVVSGDGVDAWQGEAIADRLGIASLFDADVASLSGGEAKRVALASALAHESDLLVLDEPTNHLDIDAIAWLEEHLASFRGGLVLITHDRFVLDRVTTRIAEIDQGQLFVYQTGYGGYLEARQQRADQEASQEATRRNLARRELAWLRRGAPARSTKQRARVERATALIDSTHNRAEGRAALDLHLSEVDSATPRLGDLVVELEGVGHRFDSPPIFAGLDLALDRRERLGIVGPNGSGKSTALEIIAGRLEPTEGRVVRGPTVRVGYYDQRSRALDTSITVRAALIGDKGEVDWRDRKLMERFWFDDDAQRAPISLLSGGERRRLQLLLTLLERPNVLLLDEPTNDLDLDTLRALEDFLDDWPGAAVIVSHDRALLDRTCDDVIVFEPGRRPARYPGGAEAWVRERQRNRRVGTARPREAKVDRVDKTAGARTQTVSASTLRHRLRQIDREMQPLLTQRADLEARMGDSDHRERQAAASAFADVVQRLHGLEEQWLEVATDLEAIE
ncbi:MAG TPA: ABC-F family ATP-binding cassette domain-containing protein [Acidimicrobiales bacterium]|nr:ABC-F family ATP-binding cassette domain-containing protein [Acidimicrobiales bacterium]